MDRLWNRAVARLEPRDGRGGSGGLAEVWRDVGTAQRAGVCEEACGFGSGAGRNADDRGIVGM